jgi:small-conductance mechanosensitive channel
MTNTNSAAAGTTNTVTDATNSIASLYHNSVLGQLYGHLFGHDSTILSRLFLLVCLCVLSQLAVKVVKEISNWLIYRSHEKKNPLDRVTQQPKFVTVTSLAVSGINFVIYFFAIGLVLQEVFEFNLTTYLASASIIALAISFGSQGLVQDIVSGLTLIFCDAMDVGDLVEIVGAATVSGRVEKIGLRFTVLVNFFNQRVMIPNRTIAHVSRFPNGGVDAYGDVHLPSGAGGEQAVKLVEEIARGMKEQFGAIIFGDPNVESLESQPGGGGNFLRVHFRIWPGQSGLIETTFRQRVVSALKTIDPNYSDWQVPVTYRASMVKRTK